MKNKKEFLSLLLFSLIFLSSFSAFSINANAVNSSNLTIKSNWLYVNDGTYRDWDPKPWKNKIKFNIGGKDLNSFENHGIISINDSEILFKSTAQFGFEVNAYTNVDYKDIYPNIKSVESSMEFLTVHGFWLGWSKWWSHYKVYYDSLDKGTTIHTHEYDGFIPITVGIQDILPPSGIMSLNGILFPIPTYSYDIVEVLIDEVRNGEAGAYEDIFTNAGEITEGTVTTDILGEDDFSAAAAKIIKAIGDWELGWKAGPIVRSRNLQSIKYDTNVRTTPYSTISFDKDKPFTFSLPVTLTPEVYDYVQRNTYRRAVIDYDTGLAKITAVLYGPATEIAPERVVSVHTRNPFLHWGFTVDVNFFATVPSTAKLSQAILADPYLKRGDMVWDTSFTGAYDVTSTFIKDDPIENFLNWFDNIFGLGGILGTLIGIIILGVGIYVFVRVGVPYLRRKAKRS